MDAFEMKEVHRVILSRSRTYLLHNLRPTETFWSTMMAKDLFSDDMIDEIKSSRVKSEQIGRMLDLLPARGPGAFELFCETLLECDHPHVAEYLKTMEATDSFRSEISRHCAVSDGLIEQFVSVYKHSTPMIKRFAEQKYEMLLEEQGRDLEEKEQELHDLQSKYTILQLENSQLQGFVGTCHSFSEDITREIQGEFISKTFLRETSKYLESLKEQMKEVGSFEKFREFYTNMQELLAFMENFSNTKKKDPIITDPTHPKGSGRPYSALKRLNSAFDGSGTTMMDKMNVVLKLIKNVIQTMGTRTYVTAALIRPDLQQVLVKFQEVIEDVLYIKGVFKTTLRQKRKLEAELVSLVHNWHEIRRLEREVKEKQVHISDLSKESQVLRRKTRGHQLKKQLEQIQSNVEQKRIQLRELQKALERHLGSADVRLHALLSLLPDLDDNDMGRSDTDMFSDVASRAASRVTTPRLSNGLHRKLSLEEPNSTKNSAEIWPTQDSNKESKIEPVKESPKPEPVASETKPAQNNQVKTMNRLLERRFAQQQRSVRLSNPSSKSRETYMATRGQMNKTATMKYVPIKQNKPPPKEEVVKSPQGTMGQPNKFQSTTDKLKADESDQNKLTQKKEAEQDPIDKWLAQQKLQNKSDQLQKKVAEFTLVETEDRSEEIRKLGKTLVDSPKEKETKAKPPDETKHQENEVKENEKAWNPTQSQVLPDKTNDSNTNKTHKESNDSNTDKTRRESNESNTDKTRKESNESNTDKTRKESANTKSDSSCSVPSSGNSITRTTPDSNRTGSKSNSGENPDKRHKISQGSQGTSDEATSPVIQTQDQVTPGRRSVLCTSVMAGDIVTTTTTQRTTPIVRQSLSSMMMESHYEKLNRRTQPPGQRVLASTNKVNLFLPNS